MPYRNNYVLSENPQFDAVKLRPVIPGDEYYLYDKRTGTFTKVGPIEAKELFAHDIKDLQRIIDEIIKRNIFTDLSNFIDGTIRVRSTEILNDLLEKKRLFKYMGEIYGDFPADAKAGEVYSQNGTYWLKTNDHKWKQIFTYENAQELLLNYYTKEELDERLSSLLNQMEELRAYVLTAYSGIEETLSNYVTKDAFIKKISEYEQQINDLRQLYEGNKTKIETEWNTKVREITDWRNREQDRIKTIDEKCKNLEKAYSRQRDAFYAFLQENQTKILAQNETIRKLSAFIDDYSSQLNEYKNAYNELLSYANSLKLKLDELQAFDQRILELPDETIDN